MCSAVRFLDRQTVRRVTEPCASHANRFVNYGTTQFSWSRLLHTISVRTSYASVVYTDAAGAFVEGGIALAVGCLTELTVDRGTCDVESVQLLSLRPPRVQHVVRARNRVPPLRA